MNKAKTEKAVKTLALWVTCLGLAFGVSVAVLAVCAFGFQG